MPFTLLGQTEYKDDNGRTFLASGIDVIAPYKHVIDGFYTWECGKCLTVQGSRACGWPIAGQVLVCEKCKSKNLLVKTNTIELDEAFGNKILHERELAELRREQKDFQLLVTSAASQKFVHLIPIFENILKELKIAQEKAVSSS